ncbi:bifunctional glycosyltransferase family 2 protein/CDP-glycerol:glycerophosphate glycerophosphotransferase [Streptomyces sp. RB6PN25]|uniref:Bifunctional glycosyltransferase family 2 protein/CDP-glycerol:glycerophosphate glycerophosphotransferase n=1 Tax=Streptomyces humicola TaxID=2953240 RepID=A0ABT1PZT0_9ACTN|nr:bifunctional glycosyltransferase family 2 protein/CDP-glycerol:glycerophosphate glycerophosphotransferase [Streptomyces humicola]MCQ4083139.1 bifunctional glycosyltransferase family 2 protein/CDP-glycerol:glycerophosphate glycerophosphotransferase [Streptomyces humicola]
MSEQVPISIVLPVYGVEEYLPQCLDSLLGQSFADVEVVAVDDCSPDGCGAILDEYAARDARLRVVHLEQNVGLGQARNEGLARARGEYIWFVDSDDWLADGALAAVAERLERSRPDVLVVDFALAYPDGGTERDVRAHLFRDAPESFTLAERPGVLDLIMTAWSRVVRREFLAGLDVGFGRGYYEDISVTYPVLMAARRLSLLDRVCYYYRRGREGAITNTASPKHFDLFGQYEQIFDFVDREEETAGQFRTAVFDRTVRHATTVLATPGLVPADRRREFFRRASEHFRRFRPQGYSCPSGLRGLQYRLVERDAFPAYAALEPVNRLRLALRPAVRRARRAPRSATRLAATAARRAYYRACLLLPVDENLAVYAAYWYRGYACNPAAIYEKARELAPGVRGVWVVGKDRAGSMPPGVDHVVAGSARHLRTMARAKYLVNNVNFPYELSKRPGSVLVQTQHGTPLKKMGTDLRDYPVAAGGLNFERLVEQCGRWDFLVSPNPHTTEVFTRVYPGRYEVLPTGYPRADRLVNATADEVRRVREGLGIAPGQTAVLYAPTHRDYRDEAELPLDPERLAAELGPDHVLLVRAHYFDARGDVQLRDVKDVSAHPSIEELCLAADVLVTDYSSVMFDYAALDRPIVIYAPDWEVYRRTRGVYFDLLQQPPGSVATTPERLAEVLRGGEYAGAAAAKQREEFRARFCPYDDGHAAERVVRRIFLGEKPGPA